MFNERLWEWDDVSASVLYERLSRHPDQAFAMYQEYQRLRAQYAERYLEFQKFAAASLRAGYEQKSPVWPTAEELLERAIGFFDV